VYVRAVDRVGVTRIEMRVDGQIVDTTASPEANGTTTLDSILSWTPTRPARRDRGGRVRDTVRGNPKTITMTVRDTSAQVRIRLYRPSISRRRRPMTRLRVRANVNVNVATGPALNYNLLTT